MFANFTEETCTGTGDTLALAGAVTGAIPFSASFADGDLVSYVVEDSAGSIKVAGIGTYVSATDDIARNDTWNWNGTVVDKNPSTNIALSGGAHTIRCDVTTTSIAVNKSAERTNIPTYQLNGFINSSAGGSSQTVSADQQTAHAFHLRQSMDATSIEVNVSIADASGLASFGISRMVDGLSADHYIASGTIDITTTGSKTISFAERLNAGYYFMHLVTDSSTVAFVAGTSSFSYGAWQWTPCFKQGNAYRDHPAGGILKLGVGLGILDTNPESLTRTYWDVNAKPILFRINGTSL